MSGNVLVVVAHPDDEVLGCGGTARILADRGYSVKTCILSGEVGARDRRPTDDELLADTRAASTVLGMADPLLGPFPNIRMNSEPHIELVKFIEKSLEDHSAEWIFTHHPHDLNDDHRQVSAATQAAARLFQRGDRVLPLKGLFFMEIASSTDWQFGGTSRAFEPTTFFPIGERGIESKIEALGKYRAVMRPFPHPRSEEVLRGMAAVRGGQAGTGYCEAFQAAHIDLGGVF